MDLFTNILRADTELPKIRKNMSDELEKVVAESETALSKEDKKEEVKANLDKAIFEAQETLRKTREEIKKAKIGIVDEEDNSLPQIDMEDPSAKAWDRHIRKSTAPLSSQLEKQKEEVRSFALRKFLNDKPSLANNKEKLNEFMANYDRVKTSTEQTQEGVLMDFEKAYGATFHQELMQAARNARLDQAKEDMIFSDIAIDKGSTNEPNKPSAKRRLTAEEQAIIAQWEMNGAPKVE
jgi:ElaB/YqjD/DUF883 family membrane-anchored ribosome-binding protein